MTLPAGTESVNPAYDGKLAGLLESLGASGKAGEVTKLAGATRSDVDDPGRGRARRGAGRRAEGRGPAPGGRCRARATKSSQSVALALPAPDPDSIRAVAEGALLGAVLVHGVQVGLRSNTTSAGDLIRCSPSSPAARTRWRRWSTRPIVSEAVNAARDWINTPPSDLHPVEFAADAAELARQHGLDVEVLDEKALAKGGYGGIMGVGKGSAHPPRLVRLDYTPKKPVAHLRSSARASPSTPADCR